MVRGSRRVIIKVIQGFQDWQKKLYGFFLPTVYLLLYFFLHFRFSFTHSLLFFTCYLFSDRHLVGVREEIIDRVV